MFRGRVREWIVAIAMLSMVGATILNAREADRLRNLPPQVDTVVVTEVETQVDTLVVTEVDTVLHVESRVDTVQLVGVPEPSKAHAELGAKQVVWYPVPPMIIEQPTVEIQVVERGMSTWERLGWTALGFGLAVGIDYFRGDDTEIRYIEVPKKHCSGGRKC